MEYEIIDNVLNENEFLSIKNILLSNTFDWYFSKVLINDLIDFPIQNLDDHDMVFFHLFYHVRLQTPTTSRYLNVLDPILNYLNPDVLIRAKANMYPRTNEIEHHGKHTDYKFKHRGALFYINTNDGLTILDDGTEVESVENRLILFDSSKPHNSTTCTNTTCRITINFNYIKDI